MLSYYFAELVPILKKCRCTPCLITLLKSCQLAILKNCWRITCLITLLICFPSYNIAEAYFKLSRCWDIPNL